MHKIFKKYWMLTRLSHPRKMILLFLMYTAALKASLSNTHLCPHAIVSLHKNNFLVCTNSNSKDFELSFWHVYPIKQELLQYTDRED